jgi:hypothetical protein
MAVGNSHGYGKTNDGYMDNPQPSFLLVVPEKEEGSQTVRVGAYCCNEFSL